MMMSGLLLLLLPGCATECALVEPSEGYRLAHEPPAAAQMPPNVLIVLSDDQGVDQVGAYGVNPDAPPTPNIDSLAAQGVLFRQAWSAPTCSPSRASLLTGRHSQRTGFGGVNKLTHEEELSLDEITIAEMLVDAPVPWTTSVL